MRLGCRGVGGHVSCMFCVLFACVRCKQVLPLFRGRADSSRRAALWLCCKKEQSSLEFYVRCYDVAIQQPQRLLPHAIQRAIARTRAQTTSQKRR